MTYFCFPLFLIFDYDAHVLHLLLDSTSAQKKLFFMQKIDFYA